MIVRVRRRIDRFHAVGIEVIRIDHAPGSVGLRSVVVSFAAEYLLRDVGLPGDVRIELLVENVRSFFKGLDPCLVRSHSWRNGGLGTLIDACVDGVLS